MSARATSYSLPSFLQLMHRYRAFCSRNCALGYVEDKKICSNGYHAMHHRGLQMMISPASGGGTRRNLHTHMVKVKDDMVSPPPVPPVPNHRRINFVKWAKWVLGSLLSFILPFWKPKWEKLKIIQEEVEIIEEEIETAATVVQKVATMAENVSAEMAEKLPENGKLKETAMLIEKVSKATADDAQLTRDFIHKVDELKHDIEDLETMVEPVIEKLLQQKSEGK
ncbi:uncharacterized protein LOC110619738 [Manihot esculenta]|uniref:Uncharacterized protein n=1 Tax=Manihot esculenta TaxID=3983 RepID=A0A2C9VI51_MANES|nr:uncharacterized protein LOC110619738 [Manihot esculenta]OAY45151.1 hypothetical protein MANES_07G035800v8 [Manihot esculenta]